MPNIRKGAASVIAKAGGGAAGAVVKGKILNLKRKKVLTVSIATKLFTFQGMRLMSIAELGLEEFKNQKHVNSFPFQIRT
ncbi:hypothetical protein GOY13_00260 [Wolbachia endosymbiont of Cruorifilaria tuberocauda]|uniref:hypothetical protein n=1 Tax=Wolbachia endosymbiont of Cruorifilaria tuberocauda TaxID=1812111 RepID=UPI001589C3DD|nr:hypothetical protein [Wolbachia endosymbiont of Cruorifilaria tuberocauda]QKX01415.1 hypothetical protein GOY13_00260 [Wolbachia endosymbiont of Cruorifilaria tuberocauda]